MNIANAIKEIQTNISHQYVRVLHGRGGQFPQFEHINIDFYSEYLFIIIYKEVEDTFLKQFLAQLKIIFGEIYIVQKRYLNPIEITNPNNINQVIFKEKQNQFLVKLNQNQNTGFFPDTRILREWLMNNSKDKSVLNLFSYTCTLSVAAANGGAKKIVNVDQKKNFLDWGKEIHQLNNIDLKNVKFLEYDILKSYNRIKKDGPYDILIFDPPSFQKGSFVANKDYVKVIRRSIEWAGQNAQFIFCLNDPFISESEFANFFETEFTFTKMMIGEEIKEGPDNQALKIFLAKLK